MKKFPYLPAVAITAVVFGIVFGTSWRIHELESKNEVLESQLHEALLDRGDGCPSVHVTCECPEYDEGWDDAQFAEGCDPDMSEIAIDDLRLMCDELDSYGYIPDC